MCLTSTLLQLWSCLYLQRGSKEEVRNVTGTDGLRSMKCKTKWKWSRMVFSYNLPGPATSRAKHQSFRFLKCCFPNRAVWLCFALCLERKYKSSSWNFEKFKSEHLCWESLQLTDSTAVVMSIYVYRLVTAKRPSYLKVISPGLQLREARRFLHQQDCLPAKVQMGSERPARALWRHEGTRR